MLQSDSRKEIQEKYNELLETSFDLMDEEEVLKARLQSVQDNKFRVQNMLKFYDEELRILNQGKYVKSGMAEQRDPNT